MVLPTLFCLLYGANVIGQEQTQLKAIAVSQDESQQTYVVQLAEFRMKSSSDSTMSDTEIVEHFLKSKNDGLVQQIETIRMSTLSGTESMVHFIKGVTVTVGRTSNGRTPPSRVTQDRSIGTMLKLRASPQNEKVLMTLSYESSRLNGEGTEDSPPEAFTTRVESTHLFEIGKPKLIAGTNAGETTFVLVTVGR